MLNLSNQQYITKATGIPFRE